VRSASDLSWAVRRLLHRVGVDVVSYKPGRHALARRHFLFARHEIDCVVDVGANGGQYGSFLRRIGYRGRIVSFEPIASAFAALRAASSDDDAWEARNSALGEAEGSATINVSEDSESSSILDMLPSHLSAHPTSRYVRTETVPVTTLASVLAGLPSARGTFVKIDTQGYERHVILGAGHALKGVAGVQLEMSLVPLYAGEWLMPEMINFMKERGFVLMSLEPGTCHPQTGQLLQTDGLFFRERAQRAADDDAG
jgi:FkbM family methyltransferase